MTSLIGVPLEFSEQPETGLVAVTLTDDDGTVRGSRVVTTDELQRVVARARALSARSDAGAYITLDELIDGTSGSSDD
jgi:hypothetical protein